MKKPETNKPVNENEGFRCMYSTKLNEQRLLYVSGIDGIESDGACDIESIDLNKCEFIELKVKLKPESDKQKRNFLRYTLREWWCHYFLTNIKKIVVGYRNEAGIIRDLSTIDAPDIPKQVHVSKHVRLFCCRPLNMN